jgi:hypothetical protein
MIVPRLSKKTISEKAEQVIFDYESLTFQAVRPPIPVENILELSLGLHLVFQDLRQILGIEDALGATYVKSQRICVDKRLLDDRLEGRLTFTCAHEVGHWVLHRDLVTVAGRSGLNSSAIFCRMKDAKQPIEWQADYFAACLLMPENDIRSTWDKAFGSEPLTLFNVNSTYSGPLCFDPCLRNWPLIADTIRNAGNFFNVSKQAMIIRLQDLGLIKNMTGAWIGWSMDFFQEPHFV